PRPTLQSTPIRPRPRAILADPLAAEKTSSLETMRAPRPTPPAPRSLCRQEWLANESPHAVRPAFHWSDRRPPNTRTPLAPAVHWPGNTAKATAAFAARQPDRP